MRILCLLLCSCISIATFSQSSNLKPCSAAEASQFDFWVGDWELTWSDTLHGTNHIEKLFCNCTLHENFKDPKTNFLGQSWSVFNANYKQWQQTWIDNRGGYITLTGGMVGDSLILTTPCIHECFRKNDEPDGLLQHQTGIIRLELGIVNRWWKNVEAKLVDPL